MITCRDGCCNGQCADHAGVFSLDCCVCSRGVPSIAGPAGSSFHLTLRLVVVGRVEDLLAELEEQN